MSFPVQVTSSASGDSWVVDTTSADGHPREIVVVAGLGYLFLTQTDLQESDGSVNDPLDRVIFGMDVADPTGTIFSGRHTGNATTVDVDADGNYAIDSAIPNQLYHFNGSLQTGIPWIAAATFSPGSPVWIFFDTTPYAGRNVSVVIVPEEDNLLRSPRDVASMPVSGVGSCAFTQIPSGVYIVKARVDGEIIQSHGTFMIGASQPQPMPSYPHWMSLAAVAAPAQLYGVSMSDVGNSLWTTAQSGGTWPSWQPVGLRAPALDVAAAAGPQSNDTVVAVLDVNGKIGVRLGNAWVNAGLPPQPAPMTDIALDVEGTVLHLAAIDQMGSLWTAWSVGSSGIFTRQRTPTGPRTLVDVATAGGSAFCVDTDGGTWVLDNAWVASPLPWGRLLSGSPPALQQIAATPASGGQVLLAGLDSNGVVWTGTRASAGAQATLSALAAPVAFAGELAISATDIWAVSTYGELWRYDRAGQFWDGPAWNGLHLRNDRAFLDLYGSNGSDQEVGVLVANAPPASSLWRLTNGDPTGEWTPAGQPATALWRVTLAGSVVFGVSNDGNLWLVDRAQLDQPSPAWQQQSSFVHVLSAAPATTNVTLSLVVHDATATISVADRDASGVWSQPRVIASNVMTRIPIRTCQVSGGTLLAACDSSNVLSAYFSTDAHTWNAVPPLPGAPAAIRDIALSAGGADATLIALDASGRVHTASFSNGAWQAWVTPSRHPNASRVWAVGARIWITDEANHLWQTTDMSTWNGPGWASSTVLQAQPAASDGMRLRSATNDGTWASSSLQIARVVAATDPASGGRLRWIIVPQPNADVLAGGLQSHPQVRRVQRDTEGSPPQASGSDKLVFRAKGARGLASSYALMGLPASTPSASWSPAPTLVTAQRVPAAEPDNNMTEGTKFRVQARSVLVWRPSDLESDKTKYRAAVATAQAYVTGLYNSLSVAEVTWEPPVEVAGTSEVIGVASDANGFLSLNTPTVAALTPLTPSDRVNIIFSTAWDISAVTAQRARGVTFASPSLIGDNLSLSGLLIRFESLRSFGYTIAHELGHFLGGLPHVPDTGSNNLMIENVVLAPSTTPTITSDQIGQIQGSPNVVRRDLFRPLPPPQRVSKLRVVVQTGSDGTDQNVFIDILSRSGTGLFSSELASSADNFESGHTDAFSFELDTQLDPAALHSVRVRFERSSWGIWIPFGTFLWDLHAISITGYAGGHRICDFSNVIDRTLQNGQSATFVLIANM